MGVISIKLSFAPKSLGLFYELSYVPFILVINLTILSFILDKSYFDLNKKYYQFIISVVGFLFCVVVTIRYLYVQTIDKSQTIVKIENRASANNLWNFEFKKTEYSEYFV